MGGFAAGMTVTLVSPALSSTEVGWILQNAPPRVIITAKACLPTLKEALASQKNSALYAKISIFTVNVGADLYPEPSPKSGLDQPGTYDWTELLFSGGTAPKAKFEAAAAETRTAVILWSSGTSGRSKGVLLSHHALNFATASLWHDADYYQGRQQRWLGYVPLYHVYGLCNLLLLGVSTGSTVYMMQSFHLATVLAAVPRWQITYFHMAPPVAVMLAKAAVVEPYAKRDAQGRNAFSSVVAGVTGGAPLGHEIVVEVYRRLGFRVRLGYGLSEACSTSLQNGFSEHIMQAHAGDTGKVHWGVELMIAAEDQDFSKRETRAAPVNTPGEILIRCPGVMTAYLPVGWLGSGAADPDMSVTMDALTPDGWFRTGDVGRLSPTGRLRITDRIKELIKVRGFQVAPAELEAILCSSEGVADAGVVGVYDAAEATEWPRAYVVARQQGKSADELGALADELRLLVEGRTTKYKWLQGGIVFVDEIPKSPSGKILRRILKEGSVKGYEVQLYKKKKRSLSAKL